MDPSRAISKDDEYPAQQLKYFRKKLCCDIGCLREKLAKVEWRDVTPTGCTSLLTRLCGFGPQEEPYEALVAPIACLACIVFVFFVGILHALPQLNLSLRDKLMVLLLSCYLAMHIIIYFCMCVAVNSFSEIEPHGPGHGGGQSYCRKCKSLRPRRAHHCSSCHRCVLLKDHHCWFIGQCVGQLNMRYFVGFLFFIQCGTITFCCLTLPLLGLPGLEDLKTSDRQLWEFPSLGLQWLMHELSSLTLLTAWGLSFSFGLFTHAMLWQTAISVTLGEASWRRRINQSKAPLFALSNAIRNWREVLGPCPVWWCSWILQPNFNDPRPKAAQPTARRPNHSQKPHAQSVVSKTHEEPAICIPTEDAKGASKK